MAYERLGSIAGLVFGVPGLRQIRRRLPAVNRWFDLDDGPEGDGEDRK